MVARRQRKPSPGLVPVPTVCEHGKRLEGPLAVRPGSTVYGPGCTFRGVKGGAMLPHVIGTTN